MTASATSSAMASLQRKLSTTQWLAVIAVFAFILRLLATLIFARTPFGLYDPATYLRFGESLASGEGYVNQFSGEPTAYFPIGYPLFVGMMTWCANTIGGTALVWTVTVQALLGGLSVFALGMFGRRAIGPGVGAVAALTLAMWPNMVLHSAVLLSETLFICCLCCSLWLTTYRSWAVRFGGAVSCTAMVFVRPQSIVILFVIGAMIVVHSGLKNAIPIVGLCGIFLLISLGGWTARNNSVFNAFVPMSTNSGDNLCIGNGPGATGRFRLAEECRAKHSLADGAESEYLHAQETSDIARREIRRDPLRQLRLIPTKVRITMSGDNDALRTIENFGDNQWLSPWARSALRFVSNSFYGVVLALCLGAAGVIGYRRQVTTHLVLAAWGIAAALVVPFTTFGDMRFKIPALPFISLFAAVSLITLFRNAPTTTDGELHTHD